MKREYHILRVVVLAILFTMAGKVFAQKESTDSVTLKLATFIANVNAFNKTFPQEKVYMHFDNTGYFIGENMWFKAYVVAGPFHKPTDLSGVLYVELLTPEGRVVQSCKLKIENGQAQGRFQLGNLIHSGYYEVRAYTRMMLNWDESGVFSRVFPIFDKAKTTADYLNPKMTLGQRSLKIPDERQKSTLKVKKMNMLFFPEGGNMISGLKQTVAFKVFSEDGIGQSVEGFITDKAGNKIMPFKTKKNGIGTVSIVEYDIEPYTANFTLNGKDYKFKLPEALTSGYAIGVTSLDSCIQVNLQRNVSEEENVGLAISNGGSVYFFHQPQFEDDQYALVINNDALREGVNQITLFNDQGQVKCQRMFFRRPESPILFTAKFDKESYKPFDKVTLDFELKDADSKPVKSNFSLSVRDADTNLPGSHTGNAVSNLLLSSELKGFIENIDYYFEADDKEHNDALDALMLTQGWYRYNWEQMKNPKDFKTDHYIEDGLIISGKLSSLIRHKNRGGSKISVILYDKEKGLTMKGRAVTDSLGHFAFKSDDFFGRWQMYIRTTGKDQSEMQRKEMDVHLDRQFTPDSRAYEPLDTWMFIKTAEKEDDSVPDASKGPDRRALDKYKYENLLPETVITAEKRWMNGKAIQEANIVYDLDEERTREDDTGELYLETIFDYLERNNKYFSFELDSNGNHTCYYKSREVMWVVDNKDYSLTDIESMNAKDIEAIIINDRFGAAMKHSPFSGLDSLTKTTGPSVDDAPPTGNNQANAENLLEITESLTNQVVIFLYIDKNAKRDRIGERNTVVQGFTKSVDFYSPDYETLVLPDEKDYRRTLYWNPNLSTDADGKAKATFYNNGQCTQMEIDAQTVTPSGAPASINSF